MHDIKKILVVTTSTSKSKKAIHYGVSLAKQYGATLYVYHSDYDPFDLEGWGLPIPSLKALRENYLSTLEADRAVLNNIIEKEKTPDMKVTVLVTQHPIATEVPRIVKEQKIDLLIMVAFEEGRLEHFLFSASNHEILRKMPCNVMLVKEHHSWEET
jgi:nucleotide-binding universal stress UspA family protein